ncbi:MAG: hypothetical protein A2545_03180 [Planctomycetes bacterium RIFOXYD2_FULL_41_16]|nr:MAG: hypothetical protein A2545_03180 [Planctomycetes bacterium RIFOXYD2_FULL_41_16]OHC08294.1 MAG: hypothetical protein A3K50_11270 [Planctomycetes bacterium RIFOXYD12_FULL_42_12]
MANTINLQYGLVKDSNLAHSLISAFFFMGFLIIIKNYEALKRLLFQGGGIKPGIGKSVLYFFIFADL